MTDDRAGLIEHHRAMHRELLDAIDGLSDEQLLDPLLDGWSVRDHLVHLAMWDEIRASEVARISAGYESVWRLTDEDDAILNAIGHRSRAGTAIAQARWELDTSHLRLIEAIAGATPRGLDASLYGEARLRGQHGAEHASWIRRWRGELGW
ncbi:MAG: maleylpyruvate isomerase N-terminal domain-containing protein [Dehalococcoidia bacterium]